MVTDRASSAVNYFEKASSIPANSSKTSKVRKATAAKWC